MALRLSGLASGMDTEAIVEQLMKAHRIKATKIQKKITTTEWMQEKWKDLNSKIYSFYTNQLSKIRMQGSFLTKKVVSSNVSKVEATAGTNAPEGTHTVKVIQLASAQFVTGAKIDKNDIGLSTKLADLDIDTSDNPVISIEASGKKVDFVVTENKTVGDFINALRSVGLNANFDATHKRIFISSKESGKDNAFTVTASDGHSDVLAKLGLGQIIKNEDGTTELIGNPDAKLVQARDAVIEYNGVELTGSSNNFTVNGLTLSLKEVTAIDEEITLTVSGNTEAVYNMIKDFIKAYNELLSEMNKAFYAESARGYEPLTDEEKEAMTEEQIKKWEDKIKDSLLRRDDTLGSLINLFRTTLSESISVNGKNYTLSSFGIASQNYTEKGILHISGDEDFSSALSENKLMEALTNNPEEVMNVFNSIAEKLYESLMEKMKSTSLSSALTVYNDKEMAKTLNDYKADLKKMESKLADLEQKYYKQFAAMESAMAKMNSQSSNLMSMLGMKQ